MPEREETTRRQRDDAESLARLIRHKCKHVEDGACFACLHDGLSQDIARRERIKAEWEERLNPKKEEGDDSPTRGQIWAIRCGCLAVLGLALGWWVLSSWMEASTYARLTGKQVSTWDAMWVELRVQEGAKD